MRGSGVRERVRVAVSVWRSCLLQNPSQVPAVDPVSQSAGQCAGAVCSAIKVRRILLGGSDAHPLQRARSPPRSAAQTSCDRHDHGRRLLLRRRCRCPVAAAAARGTAREVTRSHCRAEVVPFSSTATGADAAPLAPPPSRCRYRGAGTAPTTQPSRSTMMTTACLHWSTWARGFLTSSRRSCLCTWTPSTSPSSRRRGARAGRR